MRVLITGGGTREPIDGVRFITNFSTGATAAALADHFSRAGHEVTLLRAVDARRPSMPCREREFDSFASLEAGLEELLSRGSFDAVLHLAAVSDFSVDRVEVGSRSFSPEEVGKIPSSAEEVVLRLRRNPKLVSRIKPLAGGAAPEVVAFKLTHARSPAERIEAVRRLAGSGGVDWVVHNDFLDRTDRGASAFTLYRGVEPVAQAGTAGDLARELERRLKR